MRMRWKLLGLFALMGSLLALPAASAAAGISAYVGCSSSAAAAPSHVCLIGEEPGAFFESDVEIEYEVCVTFPDAITVCTEEPQLAEAGALYVNEIITEEPGNHLVSWYVEGVEVASWSIRMDAPPPPPTPPAPTPTPTPTTTPTTTAPPPPVAPLVPSTTPACLRAQSRVEKLKARLRKASAQKQRARIRLNLKNARNAAKSACN